MSGLSENFTYYLPPTEEVIKEAITRGLVILDTNVLLDAYRFAAIGRNELFQALERLGNRLWIPHQVAHEFHKNRISVIAGHAESYDDTLKKLHELRTTTEDQLGEKIRELASRVALSKSDSEALRSLVTKGFDEAVQHLEELRQRHGLPADAIINDPVLGHLQQLLEGKVGPPLSSHDEEAARKEATRRITGKEPPGYGDRKKVDPHGDYLLWVQALREAKSRSIPLLLVTRDVKEDWFWKVSGRTIGARPELVRECSSEAGVPLVISTTQSFLYHSSQYLSTHVSPDTLRQVDELPPPHEGQQKYLLGGIRRYATSPRFLDTFISILQDSVHNVTAKAVATEARLHEAHRDFQEAQDRLSIVEQAALAERIRDLEREAAGFTARREIYLTHLEEARSRRAKLLGDASQLRAASGLQAEESGASAAAQVIHDSLENDD